MSKYEEYKVQPDPKPDIESFTLEQCEEHIKDLYVCINVYTLKLHTIKDMKEGIEAACTQIQIYKELDETYQRLTKLLKLTNKKIGE